MSNTTDDLFDPADLDTVEPTQPEHTEEEAFVADTNGDPEGSEARWEKLDIVLPDFFFKRYHLDDNGFPTYNASRVADIMQVFDKKHESTMSFLLDREHKDEVEYVRGDDDVPSDAESAKLYAEALDMVDPDYKDPEDMNEVEYYDHQVNDIITGILQLLEVDPQATGISFLQLNTRTWAEFVGVAYEYSESVGEQKNKTDKEIPDWLITREEKMTQLGRKARMLRDAINGVDDKFGLRSTSLDRDRVQTEVERRLQRLAEWNFKQHADTSGKTAKNYASVAIDHCESIFDKA